MEGISFEGEMNKSKTITYGKGAEPASLWLKWVIERDRRMAEMTNSLRGSLGLTALEESSSL